MSSTPPSVRPSINRGGGLDNPRRRPECQGRPGTAHRPVVAGAGIRLPGTSCLERAVRELNGSNAITILAGAGCAGAHAELLTAARTLQAPIVHTLRGEEFAEYDNPFDVGMTGLLGFRSGYDALEETEVLLMLERTSRTGSLTCRRRPSFRSTSAVSTSAGAPG